MPYIKRESLSNFEIKVVEKIEKLILKNMSIRKFSEKIEINYGNINKILTFRQHMNLGHLGKIIEGLDGDFISIFSDEEYVKKSEVPDLGEKEREVIQGMRKDNRVREAILGELKRINAYLDSTENPISDEELRELVDYYTNVDGVAEYIRSQLILVRRAYEDQIKEYKKTKKKESKKVS